MKSALFCRNGATCPDLNAVFPASLRSRIGSQSELLSEVVTPENFFKLAPRLREVEVIFSTWGMWELSPEELAAMPQLKAVFYGAGSVKHFAAPLLERGILVTSAWAANAIPVAEYTLAQILLANKGYFRNVREFGQRPEYGVFRGRGNYGATVSVLGAGQIGRRLIEMLRPFALRVVVYDPFTSHKAIEMLGAEKIETLEEAFRQGDIVSNHLADVRETKALLGGVLFAEMPLNATFINTGRGETIKHDELLSFLRDRPDVTALLDVTDPEPLPLEHPLRALPNVIISGHIAGSIGDEVERMGEVALEEFERWQRGQSPLYAIQPEMLATMA